MQQAQASAAAVTNEQRFQRGCRVGAGALDAVCAELDPDDFRTEWLMQVADGLRGVGGLPPSTARPSVAPQRLRLVR